jgi:cytochrome c peroxidase
VIVSLLASGARGQEEEADPPEVAIGERLFLETRFAEFFARHAGDVNTPLAAGDPVVETTETTETTGRPLAGPFAGESLSCRACHLVDEQLQAPGAGMRTYADFARRSPVSAREDGARTSARNSPPLVNAASPRPDGVLLHYDGEFTSMEDLVRGTMTGRNFGWLPGEASRAIAHVGRVVREDDGAGALAQEFGGSYARVLAGTDPSLPEALRLPPELRLDVTHASDAEIFDAVATLVAAYTSQLLFEQDEAGVFVGSPYDRFLEANGLPAVGLPDEAPERYVRRLEHAVAGLQQPVFVREGSFEFHDQAFAFGPEELRGLQIFLAEPRAGAGPAPPGGVGNCAACHRPPAFTDFGFHDTGASEVEYDAMHGEGRFARLHVPDLSERNRDPDAWLPATERHPRAQGPFRRPPSAAEPGSADLGAWNVFANPDLPAPQAKLWHSLCEAELDREPPHLGPFPVFRWVGRLAQCRPERLLRTALASFKTAGLRDLSHSAPYLHTGAMDDLGDVVTFYRTVAERARAGRLRNGDPEIAEIFLAPEDTEALVAFLRSLNEDYE